MTSHNHYTFGDSEQAARRLALLSKAYDAPSRALIAGVRSRAPGAIGLALDLGSGPGHTTRLLHEVGRAKLTIGIDASSSYVEQARMNLPVGVEFITHDLLRTPYPITGAGLVFCRFFMTHVAEPRRALSLFRDLVQPSGFLMLQEVSELSSKHPVFSTYYERVAELQRHYGQDLLIGRELPSLVRGTPFELVHELDRKFELPAPVMAELHALNIATWKNDAYAQRAFDAVELAVLETRLWAIARGREAAPPVSLGVAEVVLQ